MCTNLRGNSVIKIHYFRSDKDEQWYFHVLAKNGRIILQSEGYQKKQACLKTIALIKHDNWIVEET